MHPVQIGRPASSLHARGSGLFRPAWARVWRDFTDVSFLEENPCRLRKLFLKLRFAVSNGTDEIAAIQRSIHVRLHGHHQIFALLQGYQSGNRHHIGLRTQEFAQRLQGPGRRALADQQTLDFDGQPGCATTSSTPTETLPMAS